MRPFAAYLRTSTDDHQSPTDSAAWQLRLAKQLIGEVDGEVVVTYHDVDQSRSLPWERRPRAAELLQDLRSKDRPWADLVIAEPQRAFAGNQFGLVFPVLVHYGVSLWVPEVGGRVDPESEAHDLLMSLFGGLAKAEGIGYGTVSGPRWQPMPPPADGSAAARRSGIASPMPGPTRILRRPRWDRDCTSSRKTLPPLRQFNGSSISTSAAVTGKGDRRDSDG